MTSKLTTFSDAGLSIAVVIPDTGVRKNTVRLVQRRCGFCHLFGGSLDNGPYRVKQDQRLELINDLPDSGTRLAHEGWHRPFLASSLAGAVPNC